MKKVCIFCASSSLVPQTYIDEAHSVARLLVQNGCSIVYGGGSLGLMGAVADEALRLGGEVIGVIPDFMVDVEWQHKGVADMRRTQTMSERKQMMIEISDAILVLPGSTGTMDELFEAVSDKKLGLHGKPIVLLNTLGFYDHTLAQMQRMVDEQFMSQRHMDCISVAPTPEEACRLCLTLEQSRSSLLAAAAENMADK